MLALGLEITLESTTELKKNILSVPTLFDKFHTVCIYENSGEHRTKKCIYYINKTSCNHTSSFSSCADSRGSINKCLIKSID